ncbi:nicotinate-nucleotide adenylyltransferase [Fulvimarina endophytica]|uniref:Probable nicotinate-nucleotide adenylyltransferase n=1 Tax=Fulvimarina endophytica TaxID=2293836 RepID=A0A371X2D7_9HYPH|nr:nicotinate-nucleotide adenylyltransferase [Fulvimarina endophytica]RFC63379.1 nicotinate-nucleotide adenylyltransferase [Fulvimarina endophytica]
MAGLSEDPSCRDLRLPAAGRGQAIGLYGGSFNPPHEGHLLVAERAIKRLGLDAVWWLVTPGNPLKDHGELKPLGERIDAVRGLARGPRHRATGLEAAFDVRYTADTIRILRERAPHLRFVWVMGADGLASFHRWQDWQTIAETVPIAIVDRPGDTLATLSSKFALRYRRFRLPENEAGDLPGRSAPAWVFLHGARKAISSTAMRNRS